jgi:hypothetical protein
VKPKFNDSPSWKAIMKVKDVYMKSRKVILNNGIWFVSGKIFGVVILPLVNVSRFCLTSNKSRIVRSRILLIGIMCYLLGDIFMVSS